MIVNSFNCEFGYELVSVLPYAYYLHKEGLLTKTISAPGTEPYYYFSPDHEINMKQRSWYWDNEGNTAVYMLCKNNVPNANIHKPFLDTSCFEPPPLKAQYANDKYNFGKPLYIIINRYNNEWPGVAALNRPINYFSIEFLDAAFEKLRYDYQIIYINIDRYKQLQDNAPSLDIGDYEHISQYWPEVKHIYDIVPDWKAFNIVQLELFANCDNFLTLNGGGSILASYFAKRNIIMTKPITLNGRTYPREDETNDFKYYNMFNKAEIVHLHTEEEIFEAL